MPRNTRRKELDEREIREMIREEHAMYHGPMVGEAREDDPLVNKDLFKNRRRMAWVSLLGMLIITFLIIATVAPENIGSYDGLIGWVFGALSAVIVAYMGSSSYSYSAFVKAPDQYPPGAYERGRPTMAQPPITPPPGSPDYPDPPSTGPAG